MECELSEVKSGSVPKIVDPMSSFERRGEELSKGFWGSPGRAMFVAGIFFWSMIASYVWMAPMFYRYATQGYADFAQFYMAGRMVWAGEGEQLYHLERQTDVQKEFSRAAVVQGRAMQYTRPPFYAALFVPFTYLTFQGAYVAWAALNLVAVGAAAVLARRQIAELGAIPAWVYYGAYFAYFPVAFGLALGQDSGFLMLIGVGLIVWLVRGQEFRAGCALGLGLIKFHLVLPLVLVLLLKGRWRALGGFAVVSATLIGLSAAVVGMRGLVEYPEYLLRLNEVPAVAGILPGNMPNIRGLIEGWGSPMRSYLGLDVVTGALSLLLLAWVARKWDMEAPGSRVYQYGLALALTAAVLCGYHTYSADLSLICPIVLLAGSAGVEGRDLEPGTRTVLLVAAGALLCALLFMAGLRVLGRLNVMGFFVLALAVGWGRGIGELTQRARGSSGA